MGVNSVALCLLHVAKNFNKIPLSIQGMVVEGMADRSRLGDPGAVGYKIIPWDKATCLRKVVPALFRGDTV